MYRTLFALAWLAVLATVVQGDEIPKGTKVDFKTYARPYFEKNNSGLKGEASYLVISDAATFDKTFGVGFVMGPRPEMLAKDAFDKQMVISVIKRGNTIVTYNIAAVTETDDTLYIKYSAQPGPVNPGARFASPMIVAVPKGKYKAVVFFENEKKAATVEVGK